MIQLSGSRVRNLAVYAFDGAILLALPFHWVNSTWFWGPIAGVLILSAATIILLEMVHFIDPGFASGWWDDE